MKSGLKLKNLKHLNVYLTNTEDEMNKCTDITFKIAPQEAWTNKHYCAIYPGDAKLLLRSIYVC